MWAKARRAPRELSRWLERGHPVLAVFTAVSAAVIAAFAERWLGLRDLSMVFIVAVVLATAALPPTDYCAPLRERAQPRPQSAQ